PLRHPRAVREPAELARRSGEALGPELVEQVTEPVAGLLAVGAVEADHELLTSPPSDDVLATEPASEELSHPPENGIAGGVAIPVVDVLEVIEVQDRHADGLVPPSGQPQQELQPLRRLAPVGQSGQ